MARYVGGNRRERAHYLKNGLSERFPEFDALVHEAIREHDGTPLGKYEEELSEQGIEDLDPDSLKRNFAKMVAMREAKYDASTGEVIIYSEGKDRLRLLRFRRFVREHLLLSRGRPLRSLLPLRQSLW